MVSPRRAGAHEIGVIMKHRAQRADVTRNDSLHGRLEPRNRAVASDGVGECLEISPRFERMVMRDNDPRVGKGERCGPHIGHGDIVRRPSQRLTPRRRTFRLLGE